MPANLTRRAPVTTLHGGRLLRREFGDRSEIGQRAAKPSDIEKKET